MQGRVLYRTLGDFLNFRYRLHPEVRTTITNGTTQLIQFLLFALDGGFLLEGPNSEVYSLFSDGNNRRWGFKRGREFKATQLVAAYYDPFKFAALLSSLVLGSSRILL